MLPFAHQIFAQHGLIVPAAQESLKFAVLFWQMSIKMGPSLEISMATDIGTHVIKCLFTN